MSGAKLAYIIQIPKLAAGDQAKYKYRGSSSGLSITAVMVLYLRKTKIVK